MSQNDRYAVGLLIGLLVATTFIARDDRRAEQILFGSIAGAACGIRLDAAKRRG